MDCPQCGKALDEGKVFCKYCGAHVASAPVAAETPAWKAAPTSDSTAAEASHVGEKTDPVPEHLGPTARGGTMNHAGLHGGRSGELHSLPARRRRRHAVAAPMPAAVSDPSSAIPLRGHG